MTLEMAMSVNPPLWHRLKYHSNYGMDCHEALYRHLWFSYFADPVIVSCSTLSDIPGPQRRHLNDFGDTLTFCVRPAAYQNFHILVKNISTFTWRIGTKMHTDINDCQRIKPSDLGDSLTFPLPLECGTRIHVSHRMNNCNNCGHPFNCSSAIIKNLSSCSVFWFITKSITIQNYIETTCKTFFRS